ncbi:MAG TPA: hypothetical protein VEZ19_06540, partial [Rubrobacter sp.]|nr:hypothetical protein [Rubrobacter sp.]
MSIQSLARELGTGLHGTKIALSVLVGALILTGAACGGGETTGASGEPERRQTPEKAEQGAAGNAASSGKGGGETIVMEDTVGNLVEGEAAELARAKVGEREISNMLP